MSVSSFETDEGSVSAERTPHPALRATFFVSTARYNLQRVVRQRPLQRIGLIPRRTHPNIASSSVVRITGMAFGWIGSTTAFGEIVRKPHQPR
jgi:hypothetical protein